MALTPKGPIKALDSETAEMLLPRRLRRSILDRSKQHKRSYKPAWKLDPDRVLGEGPPR